MNTLAERIVLDGMLAGDAYSQWLGIRIDHISEGQINAYFIPSEEMTNGFNIVHGGVLFSFADSIMAFCANTLGKLAVTKNSHISFLHSTDAEKMVKASAQVISIDQPYIKVDCQLIQDQSVFAEIEGVFKQTKKDWINVLQDS